MSHAQNIPHPQLQQLTHISCVHWQKLSGAYKNRCSKPKLDQHSKTLFPELMVILTNQPPWFIPT